MTHALLDEEIFCNQTALQWFDFNSYYDDLAGVSDPSEAFIDSLGSLPPPSESSIHHGYQQDEPPRVKSPPPEALKPNSEPFLVENILTHPLSLDVSALPPWPRATERLPWQNDLHNIDPSCWYSQSNGCGKSFHDADLLREHTATTQPCVNWASPHDQSHRKLAEPDLSAISDCLFNTNMPTLLPASVNCVASHGINPHHFPYAHGNKTHPQQQNEFYNEGISSLQNAFCNFESLYHGTSAKHSGMNWANPINMIVGTIFEPPALDKCHFPTPVPAYNQYQTVSRTDLSMSQHGLSMRPPFQVHSPSSLTRAQHADRTGRITLKRPRSPDFNQDKHLVMARQQLSIQAGAIEDSNAHFSCFNVGPPVKRRRTKSQKEDMKKIIMAGGSCFLCMVLKKKCSNQGPCDFCRKYWKKRIEKSTDFMWTCDVRTKLTDLLDVNNYRETGSFTDTLGTFASKFSDPDTFTQQVEHMFGLMENLESQNFKHMMRIAQGRHESYDLLRWFAYTRSILRWSNALLYMFPQLHQVLGIIRELHKHAVAEMFRSCDAAHLLPDKDLATVMTLAVLDQISHNAWQIRPFTRTSTREVGTILKARLAVFCARTFDSGQSKKQPTTLRDRRLAEILDVNRWARSYLPRHLHGCSNNLIHDLPDSSASGFPAACLLDRRNISEGYCDIPQMADCCCGRVLDAIPSGMLEFLGHSARSFARHFHTDRPIVSFGTVYLTCVFRDPLKEIFGQPYLETSALQTLTRVLQETTSEVLKEALPTLDDFGSIRYNKPAHLPAQDQTAIIFKKYRQFLLVLILELAAYSLDNALIWNARQRLTAGAGENNERYYSVVHGAGLKDVLLKLHEQRVHMMSTQTISANDLKGGIFGTSKFSLIRGVQRRTRERHQPCGLHFQGQRSQKRC